MPLKGDAKRAYDLEWRRIRREEYLEYLGGECVGCGTTENLEFHHKVPEDKEFNIAQLLSRKREIVLEELKKCELRCYDCHKKMHPQTPDHGTRGRYRIGCKCQLCWTANRAYMNAFTRSYRAAGRDKTRINYTGCQA